MSLVIQGIFGNVHVFQDPSDLTALLDVPTPAP